MTKYKGVTCRGSYVFGTACGNCERCEDEKNQMHSTKQEEGNKMSNIINFPEKTGYDHFIDEGFSPEVAAVGHALCEQIDELKERLDKLEQAHD